MSLYAQALQPLPNLFSNLTPSLFSLVKIATAPLSSYNFTCIHHYLSLRSNFNSLLQWLIPGRSIRVTQMNPLSSAIFFSLLFLAARLSTMPLYYRNSNTSLTFRRLPDHILIFPRSIFDLGSLPILFACDTGIYR